MRAQLLTYSWSFHYDDEYMVKAEPATNLVAVFFLFPSTSMIGFEPFFNLLYWEISDSCLRY